MHVNFCVPCMDIHLQYARLFVSKRPHYLWGWGRVDSVQGSRGLGAAERVRGPGNHIALSEFAEDACPGGCSDTSGSSGLTAPVNMPHSDTWIV